MRKPPFDAERILDFLSAYVAASSEADRLGQTIRIPGTKYKVCPSKDRKDDVE